MRIRTLLSCALAAVLGACSSVGRLDEEPSKAIDLSGNWQLNREASQDPKPQFEKLRPRPPRHREGDEEGDYASGAVSGPPDDSSRGNGRSRRGQQQMPVDMSYRNENFARLQVMKALSADIARAEQVTIRQDPQRFSLDYGSQVRNFTPGAVSVVGADWGVADQSSGWKGSQYVIEVKPQQGVGSTEKFGLSPDGKHLVEELHMGGRGYPTVELKRIYDRTQKPLLRGLPTND